MKINSDTNIANMELNEYNQIATEQIAEFLKGVLKEKGISINKLIELTGLSKPNVYNILRVNENETYQKDYNFGTLLTIMRVLNIHLEMSEMSPTNNIHTMGGGTTPSNN